MSIGHFSVGSPRSPQIGHVRLCGIELHTWDRLQMNFAALYSTGCCERTWKNNEPRHVRPVRVGRGCGVANRGKDRQGLAAGAVLVQGAKVGCQATVMAARWWREVSTTWMLLAPAILLTLYSTYIPPTPHPRRPTRVRQAISHFVRIFLSTLII